MSGMTLRVYRLDVATGEQTELPTVDPSPVLSAGLTQTYPPCACPRCLPIRVAAERSNRLDPQQADMVE
jgi:hypothetical protein